jgi:hypothetical protein
MIADLRAQAAELPKLRAEKEQLEEKIREFTLKVASLAAQIAPAAFSGGNPADVRAAIALALKRLRDTRKILNDMAQEAEATEKKARAEAAKIDLASIHVEYERGVRLITGEKNWDRALDKFRRYVAVKKVTKGSDPDKVLEGYRQHVFTGPELVREIRAFTLWWKQEKSTRAKESAQTRAKRKRPGRVKRPASDLRLKENRRHKQGYCRVCGKRVGRRQRLCDEHITAKVLAVPVDSTDLKKLLKKGERVTTEPWIVLEDFSLD